LRIEVFASLPDIKVKIIGEMATAHDRNGIVSELPAGENLLASLSVNTDRV
jgi:hypothetical protein